MAYVEAALGREEIAAPDRNVSSRLAVPLIIAAAALLTRAVTFGNPVVILDDQFYLLVGDAMRGGAWPFIDIWDRKPPGLFLLFAAISTVGGGSILAMQLIATAFAAATALVVNRIARLFVDDEPALLAALAYLVMLPLFGGQSGQSPVFYNLFIALAAWLLLNAATKPAAAIIGHALAAMLLCGLALSIKQVAVAEGVMFGLSFLWLLHRAGTRIARLAAVTVAMISVALLPLLLTLLAYALRGPEARDAFVYANFVSIFDKENFGIKAKLAGLAFFGLYAIPLLFLAAIGIRRFWAERRSSPPALLLIAWLLAAVLGYLAVPLFFDHYALPMLVPLCVAAGVAFSRPAGRMYAAALLVFCLIQGALIDLGGNRRARATFERISNRIDGARHGGCLYLVDGPTWLYHSTNACRSTSYLFPDHLNLYVERNAVGVDPRTELARILAQRPAVIVTQDSEQGKHNPATQAILQSALTREYRSIFVVPAGAPPMLSTLRIWQRRDLAPPPDPNGGNLSLF